MKDSKDEAGPYWSLMFEVSESYCKPVNQKSIKLAGEEWPEIVKETIIGALNTKLVSADDQIVSIYHRYDMQRVPVCCSPACSLSSPCMAPHMLHVKSSISSCYLFSSMVGLWLPLIIDSGVYTASETCAPHHCWRWCRQCKHM